MEIDFLNRSDSILYGSIINQTFDGMDDIILFDTLLMVVNNDPNGQLKVFSTNSFRHLGTFCQKGRARNEFISPIVISNQAYYKDDHVILVIVDGLNTLKELDVTASIQNKKTMVIDIKECMSWEDGEFVILDSDYSNRYEFVKNIPMSDQKNKIQTKYFVYKNNKKKELRFFKCLMKSESNNNVLPYIGKLYKHPRKNIVVQSFERMDYLLYMDFDSENYYSIHQKGSISFGDTFIRDNNPRTAIHFSDGASSSEYLMFLYKHGDYTLKESGEEAIPELLIFDWKGNFIASYKMDRRLRKIEYDGIAKVLYGMDFSENIYTYDMSQRI